jgi:hypothetical protein
MTPDQQNLLNTKLQDIATQLRDFQPTFIATTDDFEANQTIANMRMRLHLIDMEFFSLYRLMENFKENRPRKHQPTPTIDDLLI